MLFLNKSEELNGNYSCTLAVILGVRCLLCSANGIVAVHRDFVHCVCVCARVCIKTTLELDYKSPLEA